MDERTVTQPPPSLKAECGQCGGIRHCAVRGVFAEKGGNEDYQYITDWQILQCLGCDYVFCRTVSTNSEDFDYVYLPDGSEDTEHVETIRYWPALMNRKEAEWAQEISLDGHIAIGAALREVYGAMNNDLNVLAAIGMRTTFDICSEILNVPQAHSFERKIDALIAQSLIGPADKARVKTLIEAGNASAHRGWAPTAEDLTIAMDVLEHFIFVAFIEPEKRRALDSSAAVLATKVPKRVNSKKAAAGQSQTRSAGGAKATPK